MTRPVPVDDPVLRRARAVADATRRRLLGELRDGPLEVRALAHRTGLHANAVRQHLAVLRDAGLVIEEVDRAGRVGRPASRYRATGDQSAAAAASPFERLAPLLVEVAGGADPRTVGATAGAGWAAARAQGAHGADGTEPADATDVVAGIAADHGFAVTVDRRPGGARVTLAGCPFAAIAGTVVCDLHHGVLDGAATATGAVLAAFDIAHPSIRPCELTLVPTPGAPG